MQYLSTRGSDVGIAFQDAVMMGLARDGGLLLPASLPAVTDRLDSWRRHDYATLALEVMRPFVDLDEAVMDRLIRRSYAGFRDPAVTPVVAVGGVHILELFHGPTLAFKDVALQWLGNLFEHILAQRGGRLNILAATSGDTGSAAIHGVRGRAHIRIFVLHPKGRVSPVQERQMTAVRDANVHNIAVEGTFDDCQNIVKTLFGDLAFRDACALGSVNSINWARLLAQMVYYFYATFRVMERTGCRRVRFSVPTGNFGDIFAGYLAARMGCPIAKLVLATNENDILARAFQDGVYRSGPVRRTLSPSMDIQVASNFERYLYYRVGCNAPRLRALMDTFRRDAALTLPAVAADVCITAARVDTAETLATIRRYHDAHGYLLDPHTAVGVAAGERAVCAEEPMICLATAHPAKFPDAIRQATGRDLAHHPLIDGLADSPTRLMTLPADAASVRDVIQSQCAAADRHAE